MRCIEKNSISCKTYKTRKIWHTGKSYPGNVYSNLRFSAPSSLLSYELVRDNQMEKQTDKTH